MSKNSTSEQSKQQKNNTEKLVISKRFCKGDDGYRVFSIRVKEETVQKIDSIAGLTNRSRNELIGMMLDFAIKNCEIAPIELTE